MAEQDEGIQTCQWKDDEGMKKKSFEKWEEEVILLHNNEYAYKKETFKNMYTKTEIIHKICGTIFWQTPGSHLYGNKGKGCGCPECGKKVCLDTNENFISKAILVHGLNYKYFGPYNGTGKNYKMQHLLCGYVFEANAGNHLAGHGCSKCNHKIAAKKITMTKQELVNRLKEVRNGEYICFEDTFVRTGLKSKFKHLICGNEFWATANNMLRCESGCRICASKKMSENRKGDESEFFKNANKVHNGKYTYKPGTYVRSNIKVPIIHNFCGNEFWQTPNSHLNGKGCPKCKSSKLEKRVSYFLEKNNIFFKTQKRFKDCRSKKELPFDFYIPFICDKGVLIECQGIQHFRVSKSNFGKKISKEEAESILATQKIRDEIKRNYARSKGIKLIEILYWDMDRIGEILDRELNMNQTLTINLQNAKQNDTVQTNEQKDMILT